MWKWSLKVSKKEKEAKQQEDADWAAAGDGKLTKAQQAKEKQAAAATEAAKKRAEAKRLAAEEEAELAKIGKRKEKAKARRHILWCISIHIYEKARRGQAAGRGRGARQDWQREGEAEGAALPPCHLTCYRKEAAEEKRLAAGKVVEITKVGTGGQTKGVADSDVVLVAACRRASCCT